MAKRLRQRISIDGTTHWISGNSQKELVENAIKFVTAQSEAMLPPAKKVAYPFAAYAANWMSLYKENHLKHTTLREYTTILNKHLLPVFGERDIRSITTDDVQRFMNSKAAMSRKSIREMVMVLGMILESAAEDGILLRNPARSKRLTNPSRKVTTRNALTSVDLNDIICQLPRLSREQERLFLRLLIYTGMRRNEVLGLRWDDVDLAEGIICVRRGVTYKSNMPQISTPKTAAGIRQIPIPAALRQWLTPGEKDCYVIGGQETPITEKSFQWMWRRIGESIDLHGATPHIFRHNYATLLFEAGVEPLIAMKILGHTDYQTTANIYTHLKSEMMKKSSVDMEDVFRRKQEAKGVLAKAKSAKEKRSRKPAVDASLPWAGRF